MPLTTCPDCRRAISDAALACIYCGRPMAPRSVVAAAPPVAYTYDATTTAAEATAALELPYFEVGLRKFVVMSIATWGMYDIYWAYHQWARIRAHTGESLSPFWRAFFANLWSFSLFKRVKADARSRGVHVGWDSAFQAASYLVLSLLWSLPDPWWLVSLLAFVPLVPVVRATTQILDTVTLDRDRNAEFSGANMIGVCIGAIMLLLVFAGLAMGPGGG